ncbi:Sec-independent protein translocase TatB [Falsarthrobacter nasiphocae]|nr:Sec-independent protein translocase TatB [Falsarthrobacter nasiphocae]
MGINGLEGVLLLVLAVLLFGDRMPEYSRQLGSWVRNLRRMSEDAKQRLKEEVPEIQDVDWRRMDPRQYDPRRIIRDALIEDETVPSSGAGSTAASALEQTPSPAFPRPSRPFTPLEAGVPAPFDAEAT